MIARYRTLQQRIRLELEQLDRTVTVVQRHWKKAETVRDDKDAYVNSVALNLHSFYAGLENVFRLIAVEVDEGTLGGDAWHAESLRQMALDIPGVRPPVLTSKTARDLDEYRKFRHLIRNIYATNIDPNRLAHLVDGLPVLWTRLQRDLDSFLDVLETLAHADEDNGHVT